MARGPELVSSVFDAARGELTVTLTNASLVVTDGVVVPPPQQGCLNQTWSPAVTQRGQINGLPTLLQFKLEGNTVVVRCNSALGPLAPVLINGDASTCFLYGRESGLPAPPLSLTCG